MATNRLMRASRFAGIGLTYLVSCAALFGTLWYVLHYMDWIVRRDPSFYWDKSYRLYRTLEEHGFSGWLEKILSSLGDLLLHLAREGVVNSA